MMFEFIFDDGRKVNVSEHDWIGTRAIYDEARDVLWTKSCNTKKELLRALSAGKRLFISVKDWDISIKPDEIAAVKAVDEEKTTMLWRRVVKSS